MSILDRALRVGESKKFKLFERNVARINDFEPEVELETDEELRQRYQALRERHERGPALPGKHPRLLPLNPPLARRDANWMKPIYDLLGVTVGVIQSGQHDIDKQEAYSRDVVYGTTSEFGF